VNAALQERAADGMVERRRHGDADRLHLVQDGTVVLQAWDPQLRADPGGSLGIGIDDRHEP
jgi:hypothetical protein